MKFHLKKIVRAESAEGSRVAEMPELAPHLCAPPRSLREPNLLLNTASSEGVLN